jgi:hypothetical protein
MSASSGNSKRSILANTRNGIYKGHRGSIFATENSITLLQAKLAVSQSEKQENELTVPSNISVSDTRRLHEDHIRFNAAKAPMETVEENKTEPNREISQSIKAGLVRMRLHQLVNRPSQQQNPSRTVAPNYRIDLDDRKSVFQCFPSPTIAQTNRPVMVLPSGTVAKARAAYVNQLNSATPLMKSSIFSQNNSVNFGKVSSIVDMFKETESHAVPIISRHRSSSTHVIGTTNQINNNQNSAPEYIIDPELANSPPLTRLASLSMPNKPSTSPIIINYSNNPIASRSRNNSINRNPFNLNLRISTEAESDYYAQYGSNSAIVHLDEPTSRSSDETCTQSASFAHIKPRHPNHQAVEQEVFHNNSVAHRKQPSISSNKPSQRFQTKRQRSREHASSSRPLKSCFGTKKSSNSASSAAILTSRRVHFAHLIQLRDFERIQAGSCSVPRSGSYSLGLDWSFQRDYQRPIDPGPSSNNPTKIYYHYPATNALCELQRLNETERIALLREYNPAIQFVEGESEELDDIRLSRLSNFCSCRPPQPDYNENGEPIYLEGVAYQCCIDPDVCPCARDGMGCHVEGNHYCLCAGRYQGPELDGDSPQIVCGNPHEHYEFDDYSVKQHFIDIVYGGGEGNEQEEETAEISIRSNNRFGEHSRGNSVASSPSMSPALASSHSQSHSRNNSFYKPKKLSVNVASRSNSPRLISLAASPSQVDAFNFNFSLNNVSNMPNHVSGLRHSPPMSPTVAAANFNNRSSFGQFDIASPTSLANYTNSNIIDVRNAHRISLSGTNSPTLYRALTSLNRLSVGGSQQKLHSTENGPISPSMSTILDSMDGTVSSPRNSMLALQHRNVLLRAGSLVQSSHSRQHSSGSRTPSAGAQQHRASTTALNSNNHKIS